MRIEVASERIRGCESGRNTLGERPNKAPAMSNRVGDVSRDGDKMEAPRIGACDVLGWLSHLVPPAGTKRQALDTGAGSIPAQTLTSFDWLNTIDDELVLASDRNRHRPGAPGAESVVTGWHSSEFVDIGFEREVQSVLSQVVLGYSPIIDERHSVMATRLTVVPIQADAVLNAGALLKEVADVWPACNGAVSLNISSPSLLLDLLRAAPNQNVMIEVPASVAADPANEEALREIASRGNMLILKGRPERELPQVVLPCFEWSIVDYADDRRLGAGDDTAPEIERTIPYLQSGVRTMSQLRESFARGALAVIGWPIHAPITEFLAAKTNGQVVLEMVSRIDRGETTKSIDHTLMRDPVLAFELLRHVNDPSSGLLRLEISSSREAIAILGHQALRQWLVGILFRTNDTALLQPINFAALRRGLLMRQLMASGGHPQAGDEMFLCGVFSLLDRILARPIGELMGTLALPETVRQALVDRTGPLFPMLQLALAIEAEVAQDIRAAANAVYVPPLEINRALLRTLSIAASLERPASP